MATESPVFGTREHFLSVYKDIKTDLVEKILPSYDIADDSILWASQAIEYNVPGKCPLRSKHARTLLTLLLLEAGGKLNRGLSVVHTVLAIRGSSISEREARLAAVAGWCLEWLQAFFLVADDVMDNSHTRRGQVSS